MKRLSLWAYHHAWAARLLIVLCYVVINLAGFLIGDLLLVMGVQLSSLLVYLLTVVVLLAFALYPSRREKHRYRNFYAWQKTCDGILITATFLLIASAANLRHSPNTPFRVSTAQALVPVVVQPAPGTAVGKPAEKRSFLQRVKAKLVHAYHKVRNYYQSLSNTERILLLMLVGFLAGVALFGVLAWSCNLSCAGQEAAAAVVTILGIGAVAFLVVVAARAINRSHSRSKAPAPAPSEG